LADKTLPDTQSVRQSVLAKPGPNKRMYRERRRQRLEAAKARGTHTALEWQVLREIFGRCVRCGADECNLEKDHIVPLHQDGSDALENLQPICARCNAGKGTEATDWRHVSYPRWREHFAKVMDAVTQRID